MSEALRLADALDEQAEHHFKVAQECDMRPCDTLNWVHFETNKQAAVELRRLAAVEQELEALKRAISDAEPGAWIRPSGKAMLEAGGYCTVYASDGMSNHSTPLYTHPAPQAKPQPFSDPLHDDIQSVLFEVEEAIKNGCCPWQIEAAFEAYEAARRLQPPAHGIQGS